MSAGSELALPTANKVVRPVVGLSRSTSKYGTRTSEVGSNSPAADRPGQNRINRPRVKAISRRCHPDTDRTGKTAAFRKGNLPSGGMSGGGAEPARNGLPPGSRRFRTLTQYDDR